MQQGIDAHKVRIDLVLVVELLEPLVDQPQHFFRHQSGIFAAALVKAAERQCRDDHVLPAQLEEVLHELAVAALQVIGVSGEVADIAGVFRLAVLVEDKGGACSADGKDTG